MFEEITRHVEMAKVSGNFIHADWRMPYEDLLEMEADALQFSDPDAQCIWDALSNPDIQAGEGVFISDVLHLEIEALPMPGIDTLGWLGLALEEQWDEFEPDWPSLFKMAEAHKDEDESRVVFYVLYEITYKPWGDENFDIEHKLLGELDYSRLGELVKGE